MAQAKNNSSLDLTDAVSQSEAFILKNRKLLIAGIVAIIVISVIPGVVEFIRAKRKG